MAEKKRKKSGAALIRSFGEQSLRALLNMAENEEENSKLRADIWKWLAEMSFGKPGKVKLGEEGDILEGIPEEWTE